MSELKNRNGVEEHCSSCHHEIEDGYISHDSFYTEEVNSCCCSQAMIAEAENKSNSKPTSTGPAKP